MKAFLTIANFGTDEQKRELCANIDRIAMFHAYVNDNGVVVVRCRVSELGSLLTKLAADVTTNWIEYTLQFEV